MLGNKNYINYGRTLYTQVQSLYELQYDHAFEYIDYTNSFICFSLYFFNFFLVVALFEFLSSSISFLHPLRTIKLVPFLGDLEIRIHVSSFSIQLDFCAWKSMGGEMVPEMWQ